MELKIKLACVFRKLVFYFLGALHEVADRGVVGLREALHILDPSCFFKHRRGGSSASVAVSERQKLSFKALFV